MKQKTFPDSAVMVIIPAFNEAKSLISLLPAVKAEFSQVVVVDDGSSDTTALATRKAQAKVVKLASNVGVSESVRQGIVYAYDRGAQVVVRMDADGQHRPEDIKTLSSALEKDGVMAVVGNRFSRGQSYRVRRDRLLFIRILSWISWLGLGQKLEDPTSGFIALRREAMAYLLTNWPYGGHEPALIARLMKARFKVDEVAVTMNDRKEGQSTFNYFNGLKYLLINSFYLLERRGW